MASVAVNRLAVTTPAGRLADARMRVEDALRLAALDDDRLFIFRRFDFGVMPQAARSSVWNASADKTLKALIASAVHASSPGAADSHAVWFRSRNEANALLLRLLARGAVPSAWFWRLAVRDWHGQSLSEWLPIVFSTIRHDEAERVSVARALMQALEEVGSGVIMTALARLPKASRRELPKGGSGSIPTAARIDQEAEVANLAARVIARHRPAAQAQLARILPDAAIDSTARYWLAIVAISAVAIELDATPTQMDALIAMMQTGIFWQQLPQLPVAAKSSLSRVDDNPLNASQRRESESSARHQAKLKSSGINEGDRDNRVGQEDRESGNPPRLKANRPAYEAPPVTAHEPERGSAAAGLWLLVPALRKMGFVDWLDHKHAPELSGFGHALLAHVAQRQRIAPDDPALSSLWRDEVVSDEWLTAWRVGLDRWLRRRAGIRLCDLVRKRGWIRAGETNVTVRFNPDDADIRLRRIALDLDPGWVPWLGLTIRYEYRERSLL